MGSQLELFPCGKLGFNERCGKLSSTPLRRSAASRGERIRLRNRVMTARLYYWREIMRRRLDDVMIKSIRPPGRHHDRRPVSRHDCRERYIGFRYGQLRQYALAGGIHRPPAAGLH